MVKFINPPDYLLIRREEVRDFLMLSAWAKKFGKTSSVIFLTAFSILASVGISWLLRRFSGAETSWASLRYSAMIPLIMTPILGYFFIHLLFELDKAKSQLAVLSMTDELTGLFNRRHFLEQAHKELTRAQRYEHGFSMLFIDLDDFKKVNDKYGHPAGDKILCLVADICLHETREVDVLARYGGDEFAILTPGLQEQQAVQFADRLRNLLAESKLTYYGHEIQITVSVGVVSWIPAIKDMEGLIYLMDRALYAAKNCGKDKTKVADLDNLQFSFMYEERTGGQ